MKVSETWLREWVSPALDTQAIADQITMAGLEVDGIEPASADFSGVIVARIASIAPHPDADKLNVCQVDTGSDSVQVVCGASNVAEGLYVAFAQVGAVLPENFKIKKARLRGVESFGMICSASEIGLEEGTSAGILELPKELTVGDDLREALSLDDQVIEVDLTPNRGDCLSIQGVAREVGVLNRLDVRTPDFQSVAPVIDDARDAVIQSPDLCPHYLGRVVRDVTVSAPTPVWMKERLRRSGVRSIDIVVDITNYVLLELGHPMHAFDLARVNGVVSIRTARSGERLTLLNQQDVALRDDTLIIADESGPLALAGVMGGEASSVTRQTTSLFLEAAFFTPLAIAGRARSYGLHTDASHRYERGVDPELTVQAMERATQLLVDYAGARPGPVTDASGGRHYGRTSPIALSSQRVERALGLALPDEDIQDILTRLGMEARAVGEGEWSVSVPSWRFDISIEADLVEELARIHGYNRMPVRYPDMALAPEVQHEHRIGPSLISRCLVDQGYQEAITYSFVAPELQQQLLPDAESPALLNPISTDMAVMRAGLWPGLLKTLKHNLNRQQDRVQIFEIGQVFNGGLDNLSQTSRIGGLVYGNRYPEDWHGRQGRLDFFDIKAHVEGLMALGGSARQWRFAPQSHSALHPGQSACIYDDETAIGWVGALHPSILSDHGIKGDVLVFELALDAVEQRTVPRFKPLSRYPEVRRDLAVVVPETLPLGDVENVIRSQAGEWLVDWRLFDVYQGKGVDEGYKSLAAGLTWQHPSRTLNDEEVSEWVARIVDELGQRFGATLRG
ncbi:phenylalanine--tRNA ligase subunit beta [Larsenimonas rhizosphaerae]|uniref:Phenylalanine--tRNA ligase beta subunit n=1 Tax=Larsenimonas rhizosphaerae TaxID=2944682 RepID=A0AA41ZFX9_9GAMM|nr:phenylalanine--tRNA ligase subunit beta [Larsenimonas rhizosphaerae]MCX2523439.1 phenylalanine--tRNA ligase subunit beta [Larsenimonas rhizosphaerae]